MSRPLSSITQPDGVEIAVRHLNFFYGQQEVLYDINLDIFKNKITALMGPSGSGKSSLLRTLNLIYRLYPQQFASGEVLFHGKNILTEAHDLNYLRSCIGMVFQKPTPFPMSVYDNIAFALKMHLKLSRSELKERIELALRQAALWDEVKDHLKKDARRLSGGQQQRLCIARCIAIQPQVLLLDEPTAALDPISTKKVEQLVLSLAKDYTVVIVTHNLAQARRISDYTTFLEHGHLIEFGKTADLFTNPQNEKTRAYVHSHEDQH